MKPVLWIVVAASLMGFVFATPNILAQETAHSSTVAVNTASSSAIADAGNRMLQNGVKPKADEPELVKRFKEGGNVMWFLLLLSIMFVTYTIERFANLRLSKIAPESLAEQANILWKQGRFAEIMELCEKSPSVLARILRQIIRHRNEDITRLNTLAGEVGAREIRMQLQRAYPLAIAATVAPLLGLLGTVSGMIDAFDTVALAGSMGNPALLADSISKAMVCTAAGLMVAIGSLCAYHYFKGRTITYSVQIEETVSDLLSDWFASRETLDAH